MSQQATLTMPAMGGPVGPINANNPAGNANVNPDENIKRLNTYIYDYFMRNHNYECARVMFQEAMPLGLQVKQSPNQRQANGIDDLDQDSKDNPDRPKDLPLPDLPATGGHFLEDWWFQFWEIWNARRSQTGKPSIISYITHQRQAQKARNGMMGTMDPSMQRNFNMVNGAVMPADLKKAAMHNSGNMNPAMQAQMARVRAQQNPGMMAANQMERSASQMDARSGSPASGDAPSPKRPRIGEGNMQAMSQRPGQPGQMPNNQVGPSPSHPPLDPIIEARTRENIVRWGINPDHMPPKTFYALAATPTDQQTKSLEVYGHSIQQQMKQAMSQAQASSNMNKGMPPNSAAAVAALNQVAAQGSPMSQVAMDGVMADFGPNGAMRAGMLPNAAAAAAAAVAAQGGANNGSHALQDYQMQLMLLEQQNKKRLLMARQEQDGMTGHTGGPVANGQFPPNMSPSGSRAGGPSPNPNDMQRGTPKMANGPSPNGNMTGRASPAPGVFDPNNIPAPLRNQMMAMGAPNGQMGPRSMPQMPPQSQMEMFNRQAQGQMMPNGTFPGGPQLPPGMMPGQQPGGPGMQQGQTAPNMTPRQGNNPMPPPPAPQQNNSGGTQPSSPAPSAAPPTPSQTNKPKPGSKKDTKANKAAANKKAAGATAATPASEADQPPTPTPQTPSTQMHAKSGQNSAMPNGVGPHPGNGPQANGAGHVGQSQQPPQPGAMQQPQDLGAAPFGGMDTGDQFGNMLDFAALDGQAGDVLENFDFDAFLNNTTDDNGLGGFADHFNFDSVGGVEAGDGMGP